MSRRLGAASVLLLGLLAALFFSGDAATHVVNWAVGRPMPDMTLAPGDQLTFQWVGRHDVAMFPNQDAFDRCDFSQSEVVSQSSPYVFTAQPLAAEAKKDYFFGCSIGNHCAQGMKLKVTVDPDAPITQGPQQPGPAGPGVPGQPQQPPQPGGGPVAPGQRPPGGQPQQPGAGGPGQPQQPPPGGQPGGQPLQPGLGGQPQPPPGGQPQQQGPGGQPLQPVGGEQPLDGPAQPPALLQPQQPQQGGETGTGGSQPTNPDFHGAERIIPFKGRMLKLEYCSPTLPMHNEAYFVQDLGLLSEICWTYNPTEHWVELAQITYLQPPDYLLQHLQQQQPADGTQHTQEQNPGVATGAQEDSLYSQQQQQQYPETQDQQQQLYSTQEASQERYAPGQTGPPTLEDSADKEGTIAYPPGMTPQQQQQQQRQTGGLRPEIEEYSDPSRVVILYRLSLPAETRSTTGTQQQGQWFSYP